MNLITIKEASRISNKTVKGIMYRIKKGYLWYEKVYGNCNWGKKWHYVVRREDIENMEPLKVGRKKGKK